MAEILSTQVAMSALPWLDSIVVFDTETTGFSVNYFAEIIELGALKIDLKTRKQSKFDARIKPRDGKVPKKASEANHITAGMLVNCPYYETVLPMFADFIGQSVLVAHNARFDIDFLEEFLPRVGRHFDNKCIDSLSLFRELHPGKKTNLTDICAFYGCSIENAHRAYDDARHTAAVVLKLREELIEKDLLDLFGPKRFELGVPEKREIFDTSSLKLLRMSSYTPKTSTAAKDLGTDIYFTTNIGDVYYSTKRKVWGIRRLNTELDVDVNELSKKLIELSGKSEVDLSRLAA